ncbi:hypothetical protein H4S02_009106 [Coemansia sp. RSA 2611]|nr:hypothetical protein H4S01_001471 [Coemansia sp. RSA 2610]KAJ2372719.1 hypothetical protein H4S02_009106 [Coemansia sp. RSA 2611]
MAEPGDSVDSQVAVLYASQTGTAESISHSIYEDAVKRGFNAQWHVLDDHEKFGFNQLRTVVFVVSTTGDGDPPDNSTRFWRVLRRATKGKPDAYKHLRYAILGLGDTNYSNFCNTAQRLDRQLSEAGATAFYPKGLADDATGLDDVVEPWIENLWPALQRVAACGGDQAGQTAGEDAAAPAGEKTAEKADGDQGIEQALAGMAIRDGTEAPAAAAAQALLLDFRPLTELKSFTGVARASAPVCTTVYTDAAPAATAAADPACPPWHAELSAVSDDPALTPFLATIQQSSLLTAPTALKRTLLVDLELPQPRDGGGWRAGDAFNIYAPNNAALVSALVARLGVTAADAQRPLRLEQRDPAIALPAHLQRFAESPASLRDILTWTIDLCSLPRKPLLRALAEHCADAADRQRLLFLCSREGAPTFNALRSQVPTTLDILHAFPSCAPPVARLLELLPQLAPRSYSICNAPPAAHWRIAFNVVEYELEVVDPFSDTEDAARICRRGVCTPWLEHLPPGTRILVAQRPNLNGFHLPAHNGTPDPRPVLMVGPGTGVAPFIGFLEQRAQELRQHAAAPPLTWLFFGCRDSNLDYLFKDQIQAQLDSGVLTRLSACFSRDPDARQRLGAEKYVQDAMLARQDEIADLMLNQNAMLFVCGDAKGMGKDVNDAMAAILCNYVEKHPQLVRPLLVALPASKMPVDLDATSLTKPQALQVLMQWSTQKRYVRDLWA